MSEQMQLSGSEGLTKLGEMIQDIRIALLTTTGPNGTLVSLPMATQQPQAFDGRLWLLTRDESGTVARIQQNANVALFYQEEGTNNSITIQGLANVSNDRMKVQVLWNAMYKSVFPNGPGDPSIAVLTVDVTEAQCWQASASGIVQGLRIVLPSTTGNQGTQTGRAQAGRTNTIPVGQPAAAKSGRQNKNQNVDSAVEQRTGELV